MSAARSWTFRAGGDCPTAPVRFTHKPFRLTIVVSPAISREVPVACRIRVRERDPRLSLVPAWQRLLMTSLRRSLPGYGRREHFRPITRQIRRERMSRSSRGSRLRKQAITRAITLFCGARCCTRDNNRCPLSFTQNSADPFPGTAIPRVSQRLRTDLRRFPAQARSPVHPSRDGSPWWCGRSC